MQSRPLSTTVITASPRPVSETHSSGRLSNAKVKNCCEITRTCLCATLGGGAFTAAVGAAIGFACLNTTPLAACTPPSKTWVLPTLCGLGCSSVGACVGGTVENAANYDILPEESAPELVSVENNSSRVGQNGYYNLALTLDSDSEDDVSLFNLESDSDASVLMRSDSDNDASLLIADSDKDTSLLNLGSNADSTLSFDSDCYGNLALSFDLDWDDDFTPSFDEGCKDNLAVSPDLNSDDDLILMLDADCDDEIFLLCGPDCEDNLPLLPVHDSSQDWYQS